MSILMTIGQCEQELQIKKFAGGGGGVKKSPERNLTLYYASIIKGCHDPFAVKRLKKQLEK